MADRADIERQVAMPGDPDIDCFLMGLRLTSVVAAQNDEFDQEVMLDFDTTKAVGWWIEPSGERVYPDPVTRLQSTYGVQMAPGFAHVARQVTAVLSAWAEDSYLITMTSAPGKWTLLCCPGHPAGQYTVIPRSRITGMDTADA